MNDRLQMLRRWCALAWRRYLDDLARLLVGDLDAAEDGGKERGQWGW